MSVSRGSTSPAQTEFSLDQLEHYNDGVYVATLNASVDLLVSEWSSTEDNDGVTTDPDKSEVGQILELNRNEVAEIMALERTVLRAEQEARGGVGTTPGTARVDMQMYINDFPETYDVKEPQAEDSDNDGSDEFDIVANWHTGGPETMDRGVLLWKDEIEVRQGFNDTVNGTGGQGGPATNGGHFIRPYRQLFGRGPLLYPEDVLGHAHYIVLNNWESESLEAYQQIKLYFDIFEADDPRFDDVTLRSADKFA